MVTDHARELDLPTAFAIVLVALSLPMLSNQTVCSTEQYHFVRFVLYFEARSKAIS